MPNAELASDVYHAAVSRMTELYRQGDRVVVSFSGGKDSTVLLHVATTAAQETGRLPVEVVMCDEEVGYPGLYEFCEETAARPDIDFNWLLCHQPMVNIFNRENPYFWVFDEQMEPGDWVRRPPPYARDHPVKDLNHLLNTASFPPPEGKRTVAAIGLRVQESMYRRAGLYSSRGFLAGPDHNGVYFVRPVYDWTDGDVWKTIDDRGLAYAKTYDVFYKMGLTGNRLRIGPPTMTLAGLQTLQYAARAWPQWFDKVATRLPGIRAAVAFGKRAVRPNRMLGETWEQCYQRTCIDTSPAWIRPRAERLSAALMTRHTGHSGEKFPESQSCPRCQPNGSWKMLANRIYMGDPFSHSGCLPYVQPEQFREGAGEWG